MWLSRECEPYHTLVRIKTAGYVGVMSRLHYLILSFVHFTLQIQVLCFSHTYVLCVELQTFLFLLFLFSLYKIGMKDIIVLSDV